VGDALVEAITEPELDLGESPVWDDRIGRLYWVDINAGDLMWLDWGTGAVKRRHAGSPLASVRLAIDGRLVLGRGGKLYTTAEPRRRLQFVAQIDHERSRRLNDSACDAAGRLWTGTMRRDATGFDGALYRLERFGDTYALHRSIEGIGISNGIGWNKDDTVMYFIDTPTKRVDAIDFDLGSGKLGRRRPLIDMSPARPDGMALDGDGYLWVAVPSHGEVRRYSPAGRLDGVVTFPGRRVTSCCFGGPQLDELYVTSARDEAAGPRGTPGGGAVYRCRPGVRGLTTNRFRL